ncbi:hypothetical protein STAS_02646 [Striga asiatica]|uniref:Uncharacterized protein n=1 Tax=Striga asiatica TaxID=4170 RepID=A0A5A7P2M6_STRAF|nr:hypothetical protein STAS_02646 [Striga asiatica]
MEVGTREMKPGPRSLLDVRILEQPPFQTTPFLVSVNPDNVYLHLEFLNGIIPNRNNSNRRGSGLEEIDGREREGGVLEAAQGGVFLSPSDTCPFRGGTIAIGDEGKNELNGSFPPKVPPIEEESPRLFFLVSLASVLLCSTCISRSEAGPCDILAPPQAGPSLLALRGGGATILGLSSRAPLRNIERPPFLFFFLDAVGGGVVLFWGILPSAVLLGGNGETPVSWIGMALSICVAFS